jgi:hypothetical protein
MFASAERVLGIGIDAAQTRLADLSRDGSLGEAARVAYRTGMEHLLGSGWPGGPAGMSRLVRVRLLDPVYPVYPGAAMTVAMRWEVTGADGSVIPVLDADIALRPERGGGTRLTLTGCYRPPSGGPGAADRMLVLTAAELTLRSALASIAAALEGTAAAVAGRVRPA